LRTCKAGLSPETKYKKEMTTEASKRDNDTELKTNNTHKTFANA